MFRDYLLEVIEFLLFGVIVMVCGVLTPTVLCSASWFYIDKLSGTSIYLPVLLAAIVMWVAIVIFCMTSSLCIFSKVSEWLDRYK